MKCLEASDVADSIIYALSAPAHCGIHDILMLPVEQDYSGGTWYESMQSNEFLWKIFEVQMLPVSG